MSVSLPIFFLLISVVWRSCWSAESPNYAYQKNVTLSSTYDINPLYHGNRATDGDTTDTSFAHTSGSPVPHPHPWLAVNLGESRMVNNVNIYNRNVNADSLRNFKVWVGDVTPDKFVNTATQTDLTECYHYPGVAGKRELISQTCATPLQGQYVYLAINNSRDEAILNIREIEVYNNFDECTRRPCSNGATCEDKVNDYTCNCTGIDFYTGKNCSEDINDCEVVTCSNGATCVDKVNDYTCNCAAGYTGKNCTEDINDCEPTLCSNGATCEDKVNNYTCMCAPGYRGRHCGIDINECDSEPCKNNGKCEDGSNSYTCTCAPGYTGISCQTVGMMVWDKVHKNGAKERLLLDRNVSSCFWIPAVAQYPVYFKVSSIDTRKMRVFYRNIKKCPKQLGGRLQEDVSSDGRQCTSAISIQETHCDVIGSSDHLEGATGCTYECKFDKKTPCSNTVHGVVWRLNWYLFLAKDKEFQICEVVYPAD